MAKESTPILDELATAVSNLKKLEAQLVAAQAKVDELNRQVRTAKGELEEVITHYQREVA